MVKHFITVSDFQKKKNAVEGILKRIQSNNNLPNILLFKFTFSEILSCDKNT